MKNKAVKARLAARIKAFEEGGRQGAKGKVAANGFDMHRPGSNKK